MRLQVADTGRGLAESSGGEGVGLANIRERLTLLYGQGAALEVGSIDPSGFVARILLPREDASMADEDSGRVPAEAVTTVAREVAHAVERK